jgi:aminoglycoside phosphotransferase (APT) family kinase protein
MGPEPTTWDSGRSPTTVLDRFSRYRETLSSPLSGDLSARFLGWLRDHLGDPEIDYASAPSRLGGGTDTRTFGFSLRGAPREFGSELILRLFPSGHDPRRATKEGFVQNVLVREGYPVARAYAACVNRTILGSSFLVMQRLPGVPMLQVAPTKLPEMLGAAHASLHDGNSGGVVATLGESQWMASQNALDLLLGNMQARTAVFPQFEAIVGWLVENRPPETVRETVCHGDFHPLNILVREGAVSGVLDWANFAVGDPAADVAFTMMALAVVGRHVFEAPDADEVAARYLASYRANRSIDSDRLRYHRIKHSALVLLCGADGRSLWRHPPIAEELVGWIHARTGIAIESPYARAVPLP